jgi:hypothetical protein
MVNGVDSPEKFVAHAEKLYFAKLGLFFEYLLLKLVVLRWLPQAVPRLSGRK